MTLLCWIIILVSDRRVSYRLTTDFVFGSADEQKRHLNEVMKDISPEGGVASELQHAAERARGNIVIDEWSCALNGPALNGLKDPDAGRASFCDTQAQLYANLTAGWSFWSEFFAWQG
jgi:glucan 1,3-beta-glucosidase